MGAPVLELRGIHKRFPGAHALRGVDFEVGAGEVHALVGENGAGKSTLIKILAGVHAADEGTYLLDGRPAPIQHPRQALAQGIAVVYQELEVVPSLSVAENIFFGRLPHGRGGRVRWRELYARARELLAQVGLQVEPQVPVGRLGIAGQQLVEIARALSLEARVLVMDEPTSALSPREIERLFDLVGRLRERGVGMVYVSHKLDEILAIGDRVTVLRDGERIGTEPVSRVDEARLISMMVGRRLGESFPRRSGRAGAVVLEVEGLATERVRDISFRVRRGEIVGFSGLMGAGRTELARGVLGVDRRLAGIVRVDGEWLEADSPSRARALGLGLVPESRREDGIFPQLSVRQNMSIAALEQFCRGGYVQQGRERQRVAALVEALSVRTPDQEQLIARLSGGNQQKVLIARWLLVEKLKVLFVDEPTRGIDVGARSEIYALLADLADRGLAVVVLSSEMPEILGLCERIYVMSGGRIAAEYGRQEATPEKLLASALPAGSAM